MVQSEIDRTVFVCGTGRSGTTVTQVALGANEGFANFGELEARFLVEYGGLVDLYRMLGHDYGLERAIESIRLFRKLMREMAVGGLYGDLGIDAHLPDGHYARVVGTFVDRLGGDTPRHRSDDELMALFREFLVEFLDPILGPGQRWVDGTPHTLMRARFLLQLFPGAQFLHVTRDPRAVAASLMRQGWGPDDVVGCGDWLENVYARLATETRYVERAPGAYLQIRFEELCSDVDRTTQRIADFLDEPDLTFSMIEFEVGHVNAWVGEISSEDSRYLTDRFSWVYDWLGYERDLGWWRSHMADWMGQ